MPAGPSLTGIAPVRVCAAGGEIGATKHDVTPTRAAAHDFDDRDRRGRASA